MQVIALASFFHSKLHQLSKILNRFSYTAETWKIYLIGFESRLQGIDYGMSLDSFRLLFVVPDFAWKVESRKN